MEEDFFILLEPSIDPVPVKRYVVTDINAPFERLWVVPNRIFDDPVPNFDAPVPSVSLDRSER
jgi:hypothetical protein